MLTRLEKRKEVVYTKLQAKELSRVCLKSVVLWYHLNLGAKETEVLGTTNCSAEVLGHGQSGGAVIWREAVSQNPIPWAEIVSLLVILLHEEEVAEVKWNNPMLEG